MRRAVRLRSIAGLAAVALVAGCSADPTDIPIPGTYVAGAKYSVSIEFASVLQLPAKAKVVVDGVGVGVLTGVELKNQLVVATIDLQSQVQLPVDTTAELRQSTILGDIYISLQPPKNSPGPFLADGDVIPERQTIPANNIENVLRSLSTLVTGSSFATLTDLVNTANRAFPDAAEFERIRKAGVTALHDLSANTDALDRILDTAATISNTLVANRSDVDRVLADGPARFGAVAEVSLDIVDLILDIGYLTRHVGDLLVPIEGDLHDIISVATPLLRTVSRADITVRENVDSAIGQFRDRLIPFLNAGSPNVRIHSIDPGNGRQDSTQYVDNLIATLRSIGMLR